MRKINKKEVENNLNKHVKYYGHESIKFRWTGNTVHVIGGLNIRYTADFPCLESVSGDVYIYEKSTLNAPLLKKIGGSFNICQKSKVDVPSLVYIGDDLRSYTNIKMPSLESISTSFAAYGDIDVPSLKSIGEVITINYDCEVKMPKLKVINDELIMYQGSKFIADNLKNIQTHIKLFQGSALHAPKLKNVGGYTVIESYSIFYAPNIQNMGRGKSFYATSKTTIPASINEDFVRDMKDGEERHGFIKADGIELPFNTKKEKGDILIYTTPFKTPKYVVKKGDHWSHCTSIKQGLIEIRVKETGQDTSCFDDLTLDSVITHEDAIVLYRVITNACEAGTELFIKNNRNKIKKEYTIKELIKLTTDGHYHNKFISFFENKN